MLADDELREALTTRLPELEPHVEAELDRLLARADALARRRRTAYVAGLVAAAVLAVGLALGHDWRPGRHQPEPSDDVPARTQDLEPHRGVYEDPASLVPGRYRTRALGPTDRFPAIEVELDIPSGWGQDDLYAVATGPGREDATRRIDLFADVRRIRVYRCSGETRIRPGPDALGLATAITSVPGARASVPTPVNLDGYPGYRVRLEPSPMPRGTKPCASDVVLGESPTPGVLRTYGMAGWTNLLWVLDVQGHQVLVNASHGRDVTPAEQAELVGIVESMTFVLP